MQKYKKNKVIENVFNCLIPSARIALLLINFIRGFADAQIFLEDGNTIQIGITKVVLKTPNFAANKDLAQKQVEELDYNRTIID